MPSKRTRKRDQHVKNRNIANETTVPLTNSPTGATGTPSASVFENARNIHIEGSSLSNIVNITTVNESALSLLRERVALHAILNAGGRADKVKCHPGTRTEVIARIEKWRTEAQAGIGPPIFWLSGPAGAGKSAIVQTVAEDWKKDKIPQANFFFFRTDPSRNSLSPLIATLVYQASLLNPLLQKSIERILSSNPLILDDRIEEQLVELIIKPLRALQNSTPSYRTPILLIDGLDECDSKTKGTQEKILTAFDNILAQHPSCVCLLVASRPESQIQAAFGQMSTEHLPIFLSDEYSPENDIRVFVNDEFAKINKVHPLAHILDANWPPIESVNKIIAKSSGHFIYPATIMRFISYSAGSPESSLEQVLNAAARTATVSPFSQLDAIYDYILSRVKDQELLKDILHAWTLIQSASIRVSESEFSVDDFCTTVVPASPTTLIPLLRAYNPNYTGAMIHLCLADLTSLARYTKIDGLLFYHSSFPDYLSDQSRSGDSFVDLDNFNLKIMTPVWKCFNSTNMCVVPLSGLSRLKALPPNLLETMVKLNPVIPGELRSLWVHALDNIRRLCTEDDDLINFAQIIRQWVDTSSIPTRLEIEGNFLPLSIKKHFIMISIERGIIDQNPSPNIKLGLHLITDLDCREIGLWLDDFLRGIDRETDGFPDRKERQNQLMKNWIVFAARSCIPLNCVDDIPGAQVFWEDGNRRKMSWTYRILSEYK